MRLAEPWPAACLPTARRLRDRLGRHDEEAGFAHKIGNNTCPFASNLDCDDGNVCTQDSCDAQDGCVYTGQPSNSCTMAGRGSLKIKNSVDDTRDNVRFFWRGGPSLVSNMGDPTQTTRYELCIYDSRGVQMAMGVPPGTAWKLLGSPGNPKGYRYKDVAAINNGASLITRKGSNPDKAKVKFLGKGGHLPDTADLPFQYPVRAQLYADGAMCWDVQFGQSQTLKNDGGGFSAKTP